MSVGKTTYPVLAAAMGKCPDCGEGALYAKFLKIAPACAKCGADLSVADSGDGPAVFVMFVVGAIVVPVAMVLQFAFHWPAWAVLALTGALAIGLSLAMLPAFKGALFGAQWKHHAAEARLAEPPSP